MPVYCYPKKYYIFKAKMNYLELFNANLLVSKDNYIFKGKLNCLELFNANLLVPKDNYIFKAKLSFLELFDANLLVPKSVDIQRQLHLQRKAEISWAV